jgi:glutaredoxin 3
MPEVLMYCTLVCPYCVMAERLLSSKGVSIRKVRVDLDPGELRNMMSLTGRRTVPQIFIGETHVGGYDELSALEHRGGLDPLLQLG